MPTEFRGKSSKSMLRKGRGSHTEGGSEGVVSAPGSRFSSCDFGDAENILPASLRTRLYELFGQIEREFEVLYADNVALQEKLDIITERLEQVGGSGNGGVGGVVSLTGGGKDDVTDNIDGMQAWKQSVKKSGSQISQRLKLTYKTSTNKLVSSFKPATLSIQTVREYRGHRDGVWDVCSSKNDPQIIGSASADHTARIWWIDSGTCLLQYVGHQGSVNSIRFHPTQELALTSSGDQRAHIWRPQLTAVHAEAQKLHSSGEEDIEGSEREEAEGASSSEEKHEPLFVRQPIIELVGHSGAVIAADWLSGGSHVVSASWDRTANMYDAETGTVINSLTGHDQELTNVCCHASQKLIITSSKDTTFRLWDFRDPSMKVNVFQGHTQQVTTAVFAGGDCLVSGSDDRTVKVWDLKNMRSPITLIRTDSAVNRLSVSVGQGLMAVPQDNRHVRLYDMSGVRHGRLTKLSKGHSRMVCATAWAAERDGGGASSSQLTNLFSCGFDRQVLGWNVGQIVDK